MTLNALNEGGDVLVMRHGVKEGRKEGKNKGK
jgi:hypothetical protein